MKMIFVCDKCHFLFSRAAEPEQCPDCGKYAVRLADEAEQVEYKERLKEFPVVKYRDLAVGELNRELFGSFIRHQIVTKCWRREHGEWLIKDDPFVDDWSEKDYQILTACLKNTVTTGGFVQGAFVNGLLKGFVSVEPVLFGGEQKYLDLSSIHVSEDLRGAGIGTALFSAAKAWARANGAGKLYISVFSVK